MQVKFQQNVLINTSDQLIGFIDYVRFEKYAYRIKEDGIASCIDLDEDCKAKNDVKCNPIFEAKKKRIKI